MSINFGQSAYTPATDELPPKDVLSSHGKTYYLIVTRRIKMNMKRADVFFKRHGASGERPRCLKKRTAVRGEVDGGETK